MLGDEAPGAGDARVMILDAGRATLEIANPAQKRMIDEVEVGRPVAPRMRVAFAVDDAAGVTQRLADEGAQVLAPPPAAPLPASSMSSRFAVESGGSPCSSLPAGSSMKWRCLG